jgi:hypothetical protein
VSEVERGADGMLRFLLVSPESLDELVAESNAGDPKSAWLLATFDRWAWRLRGKHPPGCVFCNTPITHATRFQVFVALYAHGDSTTVGAACTSCLLDFSDDAALEAAVVDSLRSQPGVPQLMHRQPH